MSPRGLAWTVCCLGVWLSPLQALAFSDSAAFAAPTTEAGGGGRYFTGSAADGYTCKVCHEGAPAAPLRVTGLPVAGYVPRTPYEVTVDWPDTLEHVALTLEISDDDGVAAGSLQLPPAAELLASERCVGTPFGAGQLMTGINRAVIAMPDCGAQQLRFLWIAPAEVRGPVRLHGALVASDGNGDVGGDGVTEIAHGIGSRAVPAPVTSSIGGCSVVDTRPECASGWWPLLSGLAAALMLRRRQRRARD